MSDVVRCWKVRLRGRGQVGAPAGGAPTSGETDQLPPWVVETTFSRLRVKPWPLTWFQHCMPESADSQAKVEFLAAEP